jgi:phytoene synthase
MAVDLPDNSCLTLLRDLDRDRYIACLLSPADKREALASLYCFNAEIARIRDVTREILPGEMRLQWWRDVLNGQSMGDANAHPVAGPLLQTIANFALPLQPFLDLIDARTFDLYDDSFDTMNSLEGYAGETASALIQLASLILTPELAAAHAHLAGHAGVAQAMAGILLLLPIHRARGQLFIPLEILSAVGLNREAFLSGEDKEKIGNALNIFASKALEHLDHARQTPIPAQLMPAYLPVSLAKPVLNKALASGAHVFDKPIELGLLRRHWLILASNLRKSL